LQALLSKRRKPYLQMKPALLLQDSGTVATRL
jgi:hypothetical protein